MGCRDGRGRAPRDLFVGTGISPPKIGGSRHGRARPAAQLPPTHSATPSAGAAPSPRSPPRRRAAPLRAAGAKMPPPPTSCHLLVSASTEQTRDTSMTSSARCTPPRASLRQGRGAGGGGVRLRGRGKCASAPSYRHQGRRGARGMVTTSVAPPGARRPQPRAPAPRCWHRACGGSAPGLAGAAIAAAEAAAQAGCGADGAGRAAAAEGCGQGAHPAPCPTCSWGTCPPLWEAAGRGWRPAQGGEVGGAVGDWPLGAGQHRRPALRKGVQGVLRAVSARRTSAPPSNWLC